jgi:SAM-dependent methyltransferase
MSIDLTQYAVGLAQVDAGVWRAAEDEVSYPPSGHSSCCAVEEESFWYHHRNSCILALIERSRPQGPIFDIGGGNGFVTLALNIEGYPAVLIEPGNVGCENALSRGVPVVAQSSAQAAGFRSGSLPAVGLFDVLEHIDNDVDFLSWLRDVLTPGGRLYLTVPAYQTLWSSEDVHAGHFRRYRRRRICDILLDSGFVVDYSSYFFLPLVVPIFLLRSIPSRLGLRTAVREETTRSEHVPVGRGLLDRVLAPERRRILRGERAAYTGSSIIVCATKPKDRTNVDSPVTN